MREAAKARLPDLVGSGDIEKVKAAILDRYGFAVSDQYAADLIAFVEEMTRDHAR